MRTFSQLLQNRILISTLLSWCIAQSLKVIITYIKTKKVNLDRLTGAGGMPSAHSASVCSLTLAVARTEGVGSPLFAVCVLLASVVMYDAMTVRRAAGQHAKMLNKIADDYERDNNEELIDKDLEEFLGHTPLEVLAGALLGILISMGVSLL